MKKLRGYAALCLVAVLFIAELNPVAHALVKSPAKTGRMAVARNVAVFNDDPESEHLSLIDNLGGTGISCHHVNDGSVFVACRAIDKQVLPRLARTNGSLDFIVNEPGPDERSISGHLDAGVGTLVAFSSIATNLVAHDSNGFADVFVKNLTTGEISLASAAADGAEGNGTSGHAKISSDGHFVVFTSTASNLVAGDTNGASDIFVKNLTTGSVVRASVGLNGEQLSGDSSFPSISSDGRAVAFSYENNVYVN